MQLTPLKYFESLYPENSWEKEIREYLDFLKKGLSVQIIGLPGSGKNNLLRLLAYNTQARIYHLKKYEKVMHFVYIDSSEAKGRSQIDIIKLILSSISLSLGERELIKESLRVKEIFQEGLALNDEFMMFQHLKKAIDYLTIEKKLSVILLFDRFDSIAPNLTEDFFSNLKNLRNHAKYRFGVILALKRPIENTVDDKILSDFSDMILGHEVYIKIHDTIAINFRTDYIEKAARSPIDKKIRNEVITLTGGHSRLTKTSFEKIVSEKEKISDLKTFLLKQSSVNNALNELWESLLPSEKLILKSGDLEKASEDAPYLLDSGLIKNNEISIPLFKDFINKKELENNDSIIYDAEKNEILKGEVSISRNLSSSEFKLLKFMLENKDKILTKDELISAIWTDQQTQDGVTDQALDQILYRLRKKIETDPSNPEIIQTIKGQGYKFVNT